MRAVGVHEDVVVVTSRVWKTNATAVRSGPEAFLIDSPIFPDELEALPALLEQTGFPVAGLLVTHGDWDHLLGRYAYPEAAIGCGETTAARLTAEPGTAARELREFDDEHYVERPRPFSMPGVQALPVPGHCAVGERELELHPADGHTADGTAYWIPWARVLVCGDYLSPVEIPMLSPGGSATPTSRRCGGWSHSSPRPRLSSPATATRSTPSAPLAILREDVTYLEALLVNGIDAEIPLARRNAFQKKLHAENATFVSG